MQLIGLQIEIGQAGAVPENLPGNRCQRETSKLDDGAVCREQCYDGPFTLAGT